jgi:type I restriction enzyme S subunit
MQSKICIEFRHLIAPVDLARRRVEREIELLREYRTRLVADVVTGKLDVREAASRLTEENVDPATEDDIYGRAEVESDDEDEDVSI